MSLINNRTVGRYRRFWINVLRCGPMPQHIAFIMDGNRRYAKRHNLKGDAGYRLGMRKMNEICEWCLELQIPELTFYAFSIENFKRSKEEVDLLMQLTRELVQKITDRPEEAFEEAANDCRARVRIIGNLDLLQKDIRKACGRAMLKTKDNTSYTANFAVAYTSREEMSRVIVEVAEGLDSKLLEAEDVDEILLDSCMYTNESRRLDMLIRTSGETRLSDFFLWQIKTAKVCFEEKQWPEYGFWDFLKTIFKYQIDHKKMASVERPVAATKEQRQRTERFLQKLHEKRMRLLEEYSNLEVN